MSALQAPAGVSAAASQSTVFITMVNIGSDTFTTNTAGGSVSGTIFGLAITAVTYVDATTTLTIDAAGSGSGQSFFRQVRTKDESIFSSSAATYNSGNNTWSWSSGDNRFPGLTATLRFFR